MGDRNFLRIARLDLTDGEFRVLMALFAHAGFQSQRCHPARETIAALCPSGKNPGKRIDVKTVSRRTDSLEKKGMIRKLQTTIEGTKKRSVEYDLTPAFERRQRSIYAQQEATQLSVCSSVIGGRQSDKIVDSKGQQLPIKETPGCPIKDRTTINDRHSSPSAQSDVKPIRRSRRCPKDFKITPKLLTWAQAKTMLDDATINRETEKFRDWEFKVAKSDWTAAWRNWIRKADEYLQQRRPNGSVQESRGIGVSNRVPRDKGLRSYLATLTPEDAES